MSFSNSEITSIICSAIPAVGSIIVAVISNLKKSSLRKKNQNRAIIFIAALFLIPIFVGIYIIFQNRTMSITISYPRNHQIVSPNADIKGKMRNIPDSLSIWIFTKSSKDEFYYPFPVIRVDKRNWKTNVIPIGSSIDKGKQFEIMACTVSSSINDSLTKHIDDPSSAGIEHLPKNIKTWSNCIVTRKQ